MKNRILIIISLVLLVAVSYSVSAWQFNGTIYNTSGTALTNATINVSFYTMGGGGPPALAGSNSTYTDSNGNFNFNVYDNSSYLYQIIVTHYSNNNRTADSSNYLDYINNPLPQFPFQMFSNGMTNVNFYLKQAGILNLTAQGPVFQQVFNQTGYINLTGYNITNSSVVGFGQFYVMSVVNSSNGAVIGPGNYTVFFNNATIYNATATTWGSVNISYGFRSQNATPFSYIVKDMATGYVIGSDFQNTYFNKVINVPADRNYSIEIFPNQSMPVNFQWNNFSSPNNLNITLAGSVNSTYNATTKTLSKIFNTSMNFNTMISGYAFNTTGSAGFSSLNIIPYILEPGNMVFMSGSMPYNMSAWNNQGSDTFNAMTGFYNMTIPGPAEGQSILLLATANKSGQFYGGYLNISLNYSSSSPQYNFTLYPMMGGNSLQNITMNNGGGGQGAPNQINITTSEQPFNIINNQSTLINNTNFHIKVSVDYSNYNATIFTFMNDLQNSGTFYVPLLNTTGITGISVFTNSYAPKTLTSLTTASSILSNNNITMVQSSNGGQGVNGQALSGVSMSLLISNSTCDVPPPFDSPCLIVNGQTAGPNTNPLSFIIGGGKVSFEMGIINNGIIIKYINVDMIASGPPDIMMDSSATNTSTSSGFSSAMRFGSLGPKIYDYAIMSIPYTKGTSTISGLNDSAPVNISIPKFYLDNSSGVMDWSRPVWDTSLNGTSVSALAGNYSQFTGDNYAWQALMNNNTCTTNQSNFNITNPCFIDTTNSRIWLRIPHFSGVYPSITGTAVLASAAAAATSSSTGGSSGYSPSTSTLQSSSYYIGNILAYQPANVTVSNVGGITGFIITTNQDVTNPSILVAQINTVSPSSIAAAGSGQTYQSFRITPTSLSDSQIVNVSISFKINASWIQSNNLNPNSIILYRNSTAGNQWAVLPTSQTSSDSQYYYYTAISPGFSDYTIFASQQAATATNQGTTNPGPNANTTKTNNWWWITLIAVIAIIIIIFLIMKRRAKP